MHFTLSSLSSWLCQAFCSSAQQQSPEQGGAFHFLHRQRGSCLVTPTEKWMHFSLRHTLLPRFPLLHSPAPLSIALTVFLCLSLFLSQLPYYNILYLRATQHRSPPHTHTHNLASFLNFSKPNFHLCFFLARKRVPRTFLPSVCHLLGQMGLLLHEWTAHREVARGCAMMGGLCLSPNLTSILLCGCVERCVHECMQAWRDILGLIWLISH